MSAETSVPADAARLKSEVQDLQNEVVRLQRKLGDLHSGDLNSLRRAYTSLCQHVEALELESQGMVADAQEFETAFVPPELVAQELGVVAATTVGVALLNSTIRALPLKSAAPLIGKGLWLLGGAFVLVRLTGGTLAHIVGMFNRNASRKKRLLRKLEAVEERIRIMAALQQWAEKQAAQGIPPAEVAPPAVGASAEAQRPPGDVSPAASGESGEMVDLPSIEELEAAERGAGGAAGAALARAMASSRVDAAGGPEAERDAQTGRTPTPDPVLQSLRAYVELGARKEPGK